MMRLWIMLGLRVGAFLLAAALLAGCSEAAPSAVPLSPEAAQGPGSFTLHLNGSATSMVGIGR